MKHRFDPQEYLAANPDAATAVHDGRELSAWGHFVRGGFREGSEGVPNEIRSTVQAVMEASLPAPPARALAGRSAADYELGGKFASLGVYSAAVPVLHMDRPLRILDFGCGYGRLLRFLGVAAPFSAIHGVDE
ncbi:MAG TPA: class I SAM-dependent methyltransferase, partial [Opitutaceae bacterium]